MKNKTLITAILLSMTIGLTGCNNDNSTSITPSISTSNSTSNSNSNSGVQGAQLKSLEHNSNISTFLNNRSSKDNKFVDKNRNLIVGDDNDFLFKPVMVFLDKNNMLVEVENVNFNIELFVKDNEAYEKVDDITTYVDSLDKINCKINFNESAIGRQFKISFAPIVEKGSEFAKELEVEIVDGFNVYNPKELAYFNKDRDFNSDYETTTGISVIKAWEDFKIENNLTDTSEKNGFILQCDIDITDNDLPKAFFYHEGDKNYDKTLDGSLRDYSNIYYHTFSSDGEQLAMYGNYFALNASKISLVKEELKYNGESAKKKNVISHATLFRTEKKDNVKNEYFLMRDVNLIGNAQRKEESKFGGGIIMNKNHSVHALIENNVSNSWFITYFAEYHDSDYTINKCYARDNFNSIVYNYGGNVTISNSTMEYVGGPIIIQDHVYYGGEPSNHIPTAVIKNSKLENWVSGQEGWFNTVDDEGLAANLVILVKNLNKLFVPYQKTFLQTKNDEKTDKNIDCFNFICVNKKSNELIGDCEGSIKIDESEIFDYGKSTQDNPNGFGTFYSTIRKAYSASPIFQSSTGGFAFTDMKTGLLDMSGKQLAPTDSLFSGDYLAIFYSGMMLTLGYYPYTAQTTSN